MRDHAVNLQNLTLHCNEVVTLIRKRGSMEITVDTRPLAKIETDALVTYAFEQEKPVEGVLAQLDAATGGALSKLAASGELTGKMLEIDAAVLPARAGRAASVHPGRGEEGKIWHAGTAKARGRRRSLSEIPAGEAPDVPGPRE